jgi:hypothetical protein
MNVNCKLTLTDEERNVMFRRLTGKNGKGMVSRAEVNQWVKDKLQSFLSIGSPSTETVEEEIEVNLTDEEFDNLEQGEIEWIIKQNALLIKRVNILQHRLDTGK